MRISDWSADVCSSDLAEAETARWFEALLAEGALKQERPETQVAKAAANWLISDLFGALNRIGKTIEESPVTPSQGAELLALVADGPLSGTLVKQVFEIMLESGKDPARIVHEGCLKQTSDTSKIGDVIADNTKRLVAGKGG